MGVFTVCAGAMIGSGIFVLPGVAIAHAGPAAAVAYLLAGMVALPATLSQAELMSAMPRAGGIYHFVYRAFGPLPATVVGLGTWLVMMLKSAFGLVGLGIYFAYIFPVPVTALALVTCLVVTGTNLMGIKRTTAVQGVLVLPVLGSLVAFVALAFPSVQRDLYQPFLSGGAGSLAATVGLVYVSYVGVTRVAAIGADIRDPGRDSAKGMLMALGIVSLGYVALVAVVAGVIPRAESGELLTVIPSVAEVLWGRLGGVIFALAGVLALASVANAGILTAARFPFAMARNGLMPQAMATVRGDNWVPVTAVLVTGGLMLLFIGFIPVVELAELAGVFNLLVFIFNNLTVIRLRSMAPDWYTPRFKSPGYPWVQVSGIMGAGGVIVFMDTAAHVAAALLIVAGVGWYLWLVWSGSISRRTQLSTADEADMP